MIKILPLALFIISSGISILFLCASLNVAAANGEFSEYKGGPNPLLAPEIECISGVYENEHVVTEKANGRYTQYGVTGSHRFDAANVVFDGIESDGDTLAHWPIAIKVDKSNTRQVSVSAAIDRTIRFEQGVLIDSESRSTRWQTFLVEIPDDIDSVHFYLQFNKADPGKKIYMKLTDPDGDGTFYNHRSAAYESAIIESPKAGIWEVRVAMKAGSGIDVNFTLQIDDKSSDPDVFKVTTGCWYGGLVFGAWDENGYGVERLSDSVKVSWEDPYHHSGGITVEMSHFLFEDISIIGHGDGIRSYGDSNVIDGAYVADIHDDCVENDELLNLLVTDSFFDGCYAGFSARRVKGTEYDGSDNLFEIRDSLVRLEAQPTVYKPEKYGEEPGHGLFFKWNSDSKGIKLAVHNTIFLASQEPRHGSGLGVEDVATLESCSNNVIVWTGSGSFPNANNLPSCFRLTTDYSEWEAAESAWRTRHPGRPQHP